MVKETEVQHQAEYLKYANHLIQYAVTLLFHLTTMMKSPGTHCAPMVTNSAYTVGGQADGIVVDR